MPAARGGEVTISRRNGAPPDPGSTDEENGIRTEAKEPRPCPRPVPAAPGWRTPSPADRGGLHPLGRHPPPARAAAGRAGRRALPQGRVDPPDRQPQAPARALAVPLRRCATAGSGPAPDHRGLQRSTAVSEAYFARMLGLRFIAVMPRTTSPEKVAQIAFYGGESHFVDSSAEMYAESARLAAELGGHYMDQFTYAERATDWRGNNNIAESIFAPDGAGGAPDPGLDRVRRRDRRHLRDARPLHPLPPPADAALPRRSRRRRSSTATSPTAAYAPLGPPSLIEGIGRPRCEPSFMPDLIDRLSPCRTRRASRPRACCRAGSGGPAAARRARISGLRPRSSPTWRRGARRARSSRCCATPASATAAHA